MLAESWEPDMGIKEVIYCTAGEEGVFLSMQLTVGNETEQYPMRKHGGEDEN